MDAPFLSSLAAWHELEEAMDRWASIGALALAACVCVAFLLLR